MISLKSCNIILADEPTGSLDDKNKEVIIDFLKEANSLGKTIILVTHDESVSRICERVVNL